MTIVCITFALSFALWCCSRVDAHWRALERMWREMVSAAHEHAGKSIRHTGRGLLAEAEFEAGGIQAASYAAARIQDALAELRPWWRSAAKLRERMAAHERELGS